MGGFTLDQISRAERALNLPPPALLKALAERGVNVNWIFTGHGPVFLDPKVAQEAGPEYGKMMDAGPVRRMMEEIKQKLLSEVEAARIARNKT